jgi:hypothetical protein
MTDGLARTAPMGRASTDLNTWEVPLRQDRFAAGRVLVPLAPYRLSEGGRPGLIFGYGTLDEPTLDRGIAVLAEAAGA